MSCEPSAADAEHKMLTGSGIEFAIERSTDDDGVKEAIGLDRIGEVLELRGVEMLALAIEDSDRGDGD